MPNLGSGKRGELVILFMAGLSLGGCGSGIADSAEEDSPPEVWIAHWSKARATNPVSAVGDEHNRLLALGMKEAKARGVKSLTPEQRCRWIATFMLNEMRSTRAPSFMHEWRGRKLHGGAWERATQPLGCRATDIPDLVEGLSPIPGVATAIGEDEWEDTVYYEGSPQADALFSSIETSLYSSNGPSDYDAMVYSIQSQASGYWDAEVVYATASTAVSSASYWQGYFGSNYSDPWATQLVPLPSAGASSAASVAMHPTVRGVVSADVFGCIGGIFGSRSQINRFRIPFTLMFKTVIPGGVWASCAGFAAINSLAAALS